jgi:antimicrobial peptide system SdpA family protein
LFIFLSALPEHAVGDAMGVQRAIRLLLPEGWAFFSRDPREKVDYFYEETEAGELRPGHVADLKGAGSLLGNRSHRVRGIELGIVAAQIPRQAWVSCRKEISKCLDIYPRQSANISVKMYRPSYCGSAVIQRTKRPPWAWRRSRNRIRMPSQVARIQINCEEVARD